MITCFNCGKRYDQETTPNSDLMFCSTECFKQDEKRLVEGNGIIAAAEKAEVGFTDINKLKLDVHAPAAAKAVNDMHNMLGFNRHANVSERSDHSTQNRFTDNERNKYEQDAESL